MSEMNGFAVFLVTLSLTGVTGCADEVRRAPNAGFAPTLSPGLEALSDVPDDVEIWWESDVGANPDDAGPEIEETPPLEWDHPPTPPGVVEGIRYIRVLTTEGPAWVSWFEIEVSGTWAQMGGQPFNLALGRPVETPGASPESGASLLVDGDHGTPWNAGAYPPATVTLDLLLEAEISAIRLRVCQAPDGPTRHEIQLAGSDGIFTDLHVFDGLTVDGQWLVWSGNDSNE